VVVDGARLVETIVSVHDQSIVGVDLNRWRAGRPTGKLVAGTLPQNMTYGHVPLRPMTRRGKRPSGLMFSTYVMFHHSSWTPARTLKGAVASSARALSMLKWSCEQCSASTGRNTTNRAMG
jgi:hypothetical protein